VRDRLHPQSQQLRLVVADDVAQSRVDFQKAAIGAHESHADGSVVEGAAKPFGAHPDLFPDPLLLRHVARGNRNPGDRSALDDWIERHGMESRPIVTLVPIRGGEPLAGQRQGIPLCPAGANRFLEQGHQADSWLRSHAEVFAEGVAVAAVEGHQPQLAVHRPDGIGGIFDEGSQVGG
jgi:hypothetical protein